VPGGNAIEPSSLADNDAVVPKNSVESDKYKLLACMASKPLSSEPKLIFV
jgi:hypothetical protein